MNLVEFKILAVDKHESNEENTMKGSITHLVKNESSTKS